MIAWNDQDTFRITLVKICNGNCLFPKRRGIIRSTTAWNETHHLSSGSHAEVDPSPIKLKFDKIDQRYDQDLELRTERVEKYRTRRLDRRSLWLNRSDGVSIAIEQPSAALAPRHLRSSQPSQRQWNRATLPYLLLWLRSGKNLDLCLLALCSCILSLLCHQTVASLPSSPTLTSSSAPVSSPSAGMSKIDLMIKAGLFTTSQTEKEEEGAVE